MSEYPRTRLEELLRHHTSLVFVNSLHNSMVIPGKLAIPPEADQPQAEANATR